MQESDAAVAAAQGAVIKGFNRGKCCDGSNLLRAPECSQFSISVVLPSLRGVDESHCSTPFPGLLVEAVLR